MKTETVNLVERPYPEVVGDLLTAILGGVVNEAVAYDLKTRAYPLSRVATDVRAVTGSVLAADPETGALKPRRFEFRRGMDWVFSAGASEVVWQDGSGAVRPADDTLFYVDYLVPGPTPPLTDVNVGSVTRTLGEAVGREIAGVYEQVNAAYRAGFIDTATGRSLELVVDILNVFRKTGEYAAGMVGFFRDPVVDGDVVIVEGTPLRTDDGVSFATAERRVLQRGQGRIDVPVRAAGPFRGPDGVVPAGAITLLARPLAGIARIGNAEPTSLGAPDETDEQLRARARAALRGLGTATVDAIIQAVQDERAVVGEVWDPGGAPGRTTAPGTVTLLVQAEPERFAQVNDAVQRTRAAGVRAVVTAWYIYVRPRLRVTPTGDLPPEGQAKLVAEVLAGMQGYVDRLTQGEEAKGEALLKAATVPGVKKVAFAEVLVWKSDTERTPLAAIAERTVASLPAIPPDRALLQAALEDALRGRLPGAPTGGRIPSRGLILAAEGDAPATDDQIASGEFRVQATIGSERWWIYLDAGHADVLLEKG